MRGDAAPEGAALAARPCADHCHRSATRRSPCRASSPSLPGRTCRGASSARRRMRITCVDPDDTYMLDNVVRFVGQRVAAVVAETEAAAEEGCRLLDVEYEILPAVFDPEAAMRAGRAAVMHDKGPAAHGQRLCRTSRARSATSPAASPRPTSMHEKTYSTLAGAARASGNARLDRLDRRGRARSMSAPAPRRHSSRQLKLCLSFRAAALTTLHVFTERVGGGFGGKQEMLSEDLCVLATLKPGGR